MESFLIVSQNAQLLHYAALLNWLLIKASIPERMYTE